MGIGLSLILIAAGAILAFATDYRVSEVDLNAVGVILMVVGSIGIVLSLIFWSTFMNPWGTRDTPAVHGDSSGHHPN
ncbi:MAG: DUF6458 family protein [Tepidiformaceae bacterium]